MLFWMLGRVKMVYTVVVVMSLDKAGLGVVSSQVGLYYVDAIQWSAGGPKRPFLIVYK